MTVKHRLSRTHPLYGVWGAMRQRCNNPNHKHYHHYGWRGIRICERWDDFALFLEDMGERPSPKHSLDRIDVDGNYEPGNVRWATPQEQRRNTRGTYRPAGLTALGRTQTIDEWADEFGINRLTLRYRLRSGWPVAEAILTPVAQSFSRLQLAKRENGKDAPGLEPHCSRGHPYTPENTYTYPDGKKRLCRTCSRAWHKARKENVHA